MPSLNRITALLLEALSLGATPILLATSIKTHRSYESRLASKSKVTDTRLTTNLARSFRQALR